MPLTYDDDNNNVHVFCA